MFFAYSVIYRTIFYPIAYNTIRQLCEILDFWSLKKNAASNKTGFFLIFDFCTAIVFIISIFQSKSLQNDASVLFSPPSIIKDTLPEEILEEMKSLPKQKNKVCKKTKKKPKMSPKPPPPKKKPLEHANKCVFHL